MVTNEAISKYNIHNGNLVKIISGESYQELMIYVGCINGTFDEITKRLNIAFFQWCSSIPKYDLTLLTMDIDNKQNKRICCNKSFWATNVCQVQKDIHIIGYNDTSQHHIWDTVTNKIKLVDSFDGDLCPKHTKLIYIQSRQIILLIGGYQQDGPNPFSARITPMGIQRFDLKINKWTKLKDLEFNYCYSDGIQIGEDNVIIAAGKKIDYNGTNTKMITCNEIFILNINDELNYRLIKHKLTMPNIGECHLVLMGGSRDEILTIGWIKKLYKTKNFVNMELPPMSLQKMISEWYNQEMIHVFYNTRMDRKKTKHNCHYKINLKKILNI